MSDGAAGDIGHEPVTQDQQKFQAASLELQTEKEIFRSERWLLAKRRKEHEEGIGRLQDQTAKIEKESGGN